jgi:acetolactate synthase-1/2/3 large subunit
MKVGERLVELLEQYGVEYVFGVPGGQTLPLYEGIKNSEGNISHVLMRDERSAIYAADAHARQTGKTGVCDATVGPGATNLTSGLAEAYASSIPLVAIIADIPRAWEHRKDRGSASQGMYQLDMFKSISKWQGVVNVPEALDDIVDTCFRVANTGRPGPTVLCIPDDVFTAEIPEGNSVSIDRKQHYPWYRSMACREDIERAAAILAEGRKPALFVGGGAHLSGAYGQIASLSEKLGAPVATTITGKGAMAETHPYVIGVAGSMGRREANEMLLQADVIVAIGSKLGQVATLQWTIPSSNTRLIHIDLDGEEIERNTKTNVGLIGDAAATLDELLIALDVRELKDSLWDPAQLSQWTSWKTEKPEALEESPARPRDVVRALNDYLQPDDVIVCDASLSSGWAATSGVLKKSGRQYQAPRGLAGLGWGAPAAIGAAFGLPKGQQVLCIAGDGGWAYSMQEIETMYRMQLPILTIIINNNTLAWVKHVEKVRFKEDYISTDFARVDYAKAAEALGATAYRASNVAELQQHLNEIGRISGPVVIEVEINESDSPVLRFSSGGEF